MAMSAELTNKGSGCVPGWSRAPSGQPFARFVQLSQLRKLRGREQVAAVCYRVRSRGIEFLLVKTRSRRWTFPKGGIEPGLTQAQAAAIEAFEEAGVHGRMEEACFARYAKSRCMQHLGAGSGKKLGVNAYLCEVSRLGSPQEPKRNPTWFSAEKAKRRLGEGRKPDYGAELARVVDRAVARIQRLRYSNGRPADGLQKVQLSVAPGSRTISRAKATSNGTHKRRNVFCIDQF
jgi:8-oxo-dGTP pyrophosphatase MutT (NUDIX family)